jgi:hypothetical protein
LEYLFRESDESIRKVSGNFLYILKVQVPPISSMYLSRKNYSTPWYTVLSVPFANFAITVTVLVPDVVVKVPLAPGLAHSFLRPVDKRPLSSVTSPGMQVFAITLSWIE